MPLNTAKYFKFFLTGAVVYFLFIVRGLQNNHYLDWSLDFQIGDCLEIIIFTLPLAYLPLKWFSDKDNYFKDSIWFALCLSVPFVIYDLVYVGVIRGHGLGYFSTFWFLTIFYFIVLVEIPLIGYLMRKDDPKIEKKHFSMLLTAIIAWLLNWWEGSFSNHYLDWSLNMKIIRLTNVVLLIWPITFFVLRSQSTNDERLKDACLLAIYFSFIFILFDFLYLGISKGRGLGYIREYWFSSVFYPIFWMEMPLIGWFMKRKGKETLILRRAERSISRSDRSGASQ